MKKGWWQRCVTRIDRQRQMMGKRSLPHTTIENRHNTFFGSLSLDFFSLFILLCWFWIEWETAAATLCGGFQQLMIFFWSFSHNFFSIYIVMMIFFNIGSCQFWIDGIRFSCCFLVLFYVGSLVILVLFYAGSLFQFSSVLAKLYCRFFMAVCVDGLRVILD